MKAKAKFLAALTASSILLAGCSVSVETPASETTQITAETIETTEPSESVDDITDSQFFNDMKSGLSFCFVGDSITAGTATGGIPWYEPLTHLIRGEIMNFSDPGWTSLKLTEVCDDIPAADIYVVAIGINDVLFIDQPFGAASAEEYVDNLQILTDCLLGKSPDARFYFINAWPALNFPDETYQTYQDFEDALREWCDGEQRIMIDPCDTIMETLAEVDTSVYMWNDFHPDTPEGINLYSYAVLVNAE